MKKILLSIFLLTLSITSYAKKVKFAVDMAGQILSPNGIHVFGDFQTTAGFAGGDWNPGSTFCLQEGTTDIYSIIVEIPAFAKYEYKFVNGDQSYEAEFIPEQSRVGYNFNDNRWIYVDSLADDTTFIGAILFAGNAPAGLTLVRFIVDMQNENVSSAGVHIASSFQNWNPATDILYSFGSDVYELISYVNTGTHNYKFYNGNSAGTDEIIPALCSVFGNREIQISGDSVLAPVCFSLCTACVTGLEENLSAENIHIAPNPANDFILVRFDDNAAIYTIRLIDISDREVRLYKKYSEKTLLLERESLEPGIYFLSISTSTNLYTTKIVFE